MYLRTIVFKTIVSAVPPHRQKVRMVGLEPTISAVQEQRIPTFLHPVSGQTGNRTRIVCLQSTYVPITPLAQKVGDTGVEPVCQTRQRFYRPPVAPATISPIKMWTVRDSNPYLRC